MRLITHQIRQNINALKARKKNLKGQEAKAIQDKINALQDEHSLILKVLEK